MMSAIAARDGGGITNHDVNTPIQSAQDNWQDDCKFLELPRELRDEIYRYSLKDATTILYSRYSHEGHGRPRTRAPALLGVSKQIRQEASPVYYLENNFVINISNFDTKILRMFLKQAASFWNHRDFKMSYIVKRSDIEWSGKYGQAEYLRSFFDGEVPMCREEDCMDPASEDRWHNACALFDMVKKLKEANASKEILNIVLAGYSTATAYLTYWD